MEIRQPKPQEIDAVKQLWSSCFEKEEEPFFQWFFSNRYRAENALGAFDVGQLFSALHITSYTVRLRGSNMSAGYLMGVGTFAKYRQRGCMTSLLAAALAEMRRRGEWISILLPRIPSIYMRHGWEICYYTFKYSLPAQSLAPSDEVNGWRQIQLGEDIQPLDRIYCQYMQSYHGYVRRNQGNWQELITENNGEGGQFYLLELEEMPAGYIMLVKVGGRLLVKEMAYINGQARKLILGFIKRQAGGCAGIDWHLPIGDPSYLEFADERSGITLYPYTSGRIVDVMQALSQYRAPTDLQGTVTVGITDVMAPWNNGVFSLVVEGTSLIVTHGEEPDVEMTIGSFSQLFFGSVDAAALVSNGRVTVNRPAGFSLLQQLFPRQDNVIFENF